MKKVASKEEKVEQEKGVLFVDKVTGNMYKEIGSRVQAGALSSFK